MICDDCQNKSICKFKECLPIVKNSAEEKLEELKKIYENLPLSSAVMVRCSNYAQKSKPVLWQ